MIHSITTSIGHFCKKSASELGIADVAIDVIEDVNLVRPEDWGCVVDGGHRFLCLDYLRGLQNSHDDGLELRYVIFRRKEAVVGVAAFQITHFTTSEDAYSGWFLKSVNHVAEFIRGKHVHNILICGNAIATGEHGFSFIPGFSDSEMAVLIASAMRIIAEREGKKGKRICAMVAKDYYPDSVGFARELTKARFRTFQVDHNMVMPLLPEWKSFDNYLSDLNTKFRTKAKAAMNKSAELEIINGIPEEVEALMPELQKLYDNVHSKADFRLGKLNLKALSELLKELPSHFTVRLYKHDGKVVGFMSAMRCGDVMEAHVIGIDYNKNRDFAVYQRMLYDYIDLAIRTNCRRIVFGRTAAEIKSTVGAFPVDLTCCVLHRRKVSNALLSLILQYIKPSEYPQRDPYKADVLERIQKIPLYD